MLNEVLQDCPLELRPILSSDLVLRLTNGSTITFVGSNNQSYSNIRGNTFNLCLVDEGAYIDDLDVLIDDVLFPTLRTTKGFLVIASTPAPTEDHPLYEIRSYLQSIGSYIHMSILEAHNLDKEAVPLVDIQKWHKDVPNEFTWQREYLAEWVRDPSKVIIIEWDKKYIHDVVHDEYFPWYHKYTSLDFGVRDKTACLFGYYDFRLAKLIIEDEFTLQGEEVRTDNIANQVKRIERNLDYQVLHDTKDLKYKLMNQNERVYRRIADNDNLQSIQDLNALYDLNFHGTSKDELIAMINAVRLWIKDGRVLINSKCKELIGCLENATWDKNHKEMSRSKVYGHFDMLAAFTYLVRNIDQSTNPIPENIFKTPYTHAIPFQAYQPNTSSFQLESALKRKPTDVDKSREQFIKGKQDRF